MQSISTKLGVVLFSIAVYLQIISSIPQVSSHQEATFAPIMVGRPVGGGVLTFEHVREKSTWELILPNSATLPRSWSPDGCNLLLSGSARGEWFIASTRRKELIEVPLLTEGILSAPIVWSIDGDVLYFSVRTNKDETQDETDIIALEMENHTINRSFHFDKNIRMIKWLSDTDLLYETTDGEYIWNTKTGQSSFYQKVHNVPIDWQDELRVSFRSPNRRFLARYFSLTALQSYQYDPNPADADIPGYLSTLEAIPRTPGFDLFSFAEESIQHFNMNGQFLQGLEWSPSSERLVMTTYPLTTPDDVNGIYVYDLKADALQRVGDFPAMRNAEYGPYLPSWSSDSNWLALNTPDGYTVYNITTRETIELSDQFTGSYMQLLWSPTMDYDDTVCT